MRELGITYTAGERKNLGQTAAQREAEKYQRWLAEQPTKKL